MFQVWDRIIDRNDKRPTPLLMVYDVEDVYKRGWIYGLIVLSPFWQKQEASADTLEWNWQNQSGLDIFWKVFWGDFSEPKNESLNERWHYGTSLPEMGRSKYHLILGFRKITLLHLYQTCVTLATTLTLTWWYESGLNLGNTGKNDAKPPGR